MTPSPLQTPRADCPSPVLRIIPFAYVADVERSLAFYALLGFRETSVERGPDGRVEWAWAESPATTSVGQPAAIMFGRSSEPLVTVAQGVFFYMHCADAASLRAHLLAHGLGDGGVRVGAPGAERKPCMVFALAHPPYMPAGEFHIHDPDGYSILIGQPS